MKFRKKTMGLGCSTCRMNCHKKVTEEQRKSFLMASMMVTKEKHLTVVHKKNKDRRQNIIYHIPHQETKIPVCRSMFVGTLGWLKNKFYSINLFILF